MGIVVFLCVLSEWSTWVCYRISTSALSFPCSSSDSRITVDFWHSFGFPYCVVWCVDEAQLPLVQPFLHYQDDPEF